jgi:hypothetical protein
MYSSAQVFLVKLPDHTSGVLSCSHCSALQARGSSDNRTTLEMLAFRRIACGVKPVSLKQVRHGTSIKVVLLEEVQNRGKRGEVVPVKRGFARNYLIPRKMAGKG